MDGTTEDKSFAPGYGEFFTGGGGRCRGARARGAHGRASAKTPREFVILERGAATAFDAAGSQDWKAARAAATGGMPPGRPSRRRGAARLGPERRRALETLDAGIQARRAPAARQAALDVARWSLDLQLRHRPDRDRPRTLRPLGSPADVDAAAGDAAAVNGDFFTLDYVRDRIQHTLDEADRTHLNTQLEELNGAVADQGSPPGCPALRGRPLGNLAQVADWAGWSRMSREGLPAPRFSVERKLAGGAFPARGIAPRRPQRRGDERPRAVGDDEPVNERASATATFLFTDIEGSTQLATRLRDAYPEVLAKHHRAARRRSPRTAAPAMDTQGDSFFVAFPRPRDAVGAAADVQRTLAGHAWPDGVAIRVRIGIHTGRPTSRESATSGSPCIARPASRPSGTGAGARLADDRQSPRGRHRPSRRPDAQGPRRLRAQGHRAAHTHLPARRRRAPAAFPPLEAPRPERRGDLGPASRCSRRSARGRDARGRLRPHARRQRPSGSRPQQPRPLRPRDPRANGRRQDRRRADLVVAAGNYVWVTHYVIGRRGLGFDRPAIATSRGWTRERTKPSSSGEACRRAG